jgi:hypothetical protein
MEHTLLVRIARGWLLAWLLLILGAAPVLAAVDLAGQWAPRNQEDDEERGPGPPLVQYWGLPINDAARDRALAYVPDILALPERQCLDYGPEYRLFNPSGMKIWADYDPITGSPIAWNMSAFLDLPKIKIWMDDRPDPGPTALHTFAGFMTGKWVGDTLVVSVTHVKEAYLRRNGVPASDRFTMTLYISRHGDLLSMMGIMQDPAYLTEPYVLSRIFKLMPTDIGLRTTTVPCIPSDELPELKNHYIPQNLPGRNPDLNDMLKKYNIPTAAALGGAQTMYPEYQKTLIKDGYKPPKNYCTSYCCGWGGPQTATAKLECKVL